MKYCLTASILLWCIGTWAQQTDSIKSLSLDEITVTSYKEEPLRETSLSISVASIDSLSSYDNYNLTDLMAKMPGVSMMSTGVAISKPVIRGLYGNRVLVLLSGLRFDNQQWQEEHGLGLPDIGLSKVELIKGAMGVLYGTEAIGGIINLIEEEKCAKNTSQSDVSIKLNTNTLGGTLQGGYKKHTDNKWYRVRLGIENNADYSDGNSNRVLNSRFDGYTLKATMGWQKKRLISTNNFFSSFNRFGFIFNDIYSFVSPDARWSRQLGVNPAHWVLLNIFSSENKLIVNDKTKFLFNAGVQSNKRMENEGGGAISLNMHLLTVQYLLKWEKELSENNRFIISHLNSLENNTNFGARKIVPDAYMYETNVSAYFETNIYDAIVLENGIGTGLKWIKTLLTPTVNSPEKEIEPFSKFSPYYNAFSGITFFSDNGFNIKANAATGVRVPNLAELSSNGLHEGVFTYEIGDPTMKNEQNISFNFFANYTRPRLDISVSPFYNLLYNYVYLTPTGEDWFGFPVYRFKQQNAVQYGSEISIEANPSKQLTTGISCSGMISRTADGNYTAFIPASKVSPKLSYTINTTKQIPISIFTHVDYCFAQNNTAPHEIKTPAYWLWNMGLTTSFDSKNVSYRISITGNNLLNVSYYDHLSRFKEFNLLNIGRNVVINFNMQLHNNL